MIRADHGYGADCTETYEYDGRGNIVSRKRYMYTSPGIPVQDQVLRETITYKYEDDSFADLLTEYNGQELTYDTIGNPLTYRDGMRMTWKHGRSLQSIVKGGVTQGSYNYNGDGLRTYKSTNGYGTTEYHILDGQYVGETKSINGKIYHTLYLYDDAGSIIGLQSGGETYYLSKTLEGDVTAVLDESGRKVAQYVYDMWGKLVGVYDGAGKAVTDPEHIALRNPFRYRGYMYDEESGLYYLQSRYYDPVTGRFVNADGFVSTGTGLMGNNMFAYCNNNPVMNVDPSGLRPIAEIQASIALAKGNLNDAIAKRDMIKQNIVNCIRGYDALDSLRAVKQVYLCESQLATFEAELANALGYPVAGYTGPGETYDTHGNARDLRAPIGTPIYAAMGGTVTAVVMQYPNNYNYNPQTGVATGGATAAIAGTMASYGNYIDIQVWDGTTIRYAHQQQSSFVNVGDQVIAGQQIGLVGNVGNSTGGHLHIEANKGNVLDYFLH